MTRDKVVEVLKTHQGCLKAQNNGECKFNLVPRCELCKYYTSDEEFNEAESMVIKALEQEPCEDARWVPVSEEYPTKNGRYLVTVKQGYITFGAWVDVAENWAQVTAWMPLPEPYREERAEE